MANLITTAYFIGDINVPLTNNPTLDEVFTASIAQYEPEVLKDLLGYTLYKALQAQIDAGSGSYTAPWKKFIEGDEFSFEFNGTTVNEKWNGLVNSSKKSLIAYYIYYWHRKYDVTAYSGIGETASKKENSVNASPYGKMVMAYNNMTALYGGVSGIVQRNVSFQDSGNYVHYDANPSAYNYLLANINDFDGWVFKPKCRKTFLG